MATCSSHISLSLCLLRLCARLPIGRRVGRRVRENRPVAEHNRSESIPVARQLAPVSIRQLRFTHVSLSLCLRAPAPDNASECGTRFPSPSPSLGSPPFLHGSQSSAALLATLYSSCSHALTHTSRAVLTLPNL